MAITYPLTAPTSVIGVAQVTLRTQQAISISTSPFTYQQQVIDYDGERWEMDVTIPPVLEEYAEPWVSFLTSLRGQLGTFYMGDPARANPRGDVTSGTITGAAGDRTVSLSTSGVVKAGDMFSTNGGLYKVLQDRSGSGSLEIWPALRSSGSSSTWVNPKGKFRLSTNTSSWSVNESSAYGIQFSAIEVIE